MNYFSPCWHRGTGGVIYTETYPSGPLSTKIIIVQGKNVLHKIKR